MLSKKRPSEDDVFSTYGVEELLEMANKKRMFQSQVAELQSQIDTKAAAECKRLKDVVIEKEEHLASTIAESEQCIRDYAYKICSEREIAIKPMRVELKKAKKEMQTTQTAMRNLIEQSQGLDPKVAAARAKANNLKAYEVGHFEIRIPKGTPGLCFQSAPFDMVMSLLGDQESTQDVQVARSVLDSVDDYYINLNKLDAAGVRERAW